MSSGRESPLFCYLSQEYYMYGRAVWKRINPLTNWCLQQTNSHLSSSSTVLRLNLYECMSPWIQHDTWEHRGRTPNKNGRTPGHVHNIQKNTESFFNLAKHWLQHGEPVRGTVYKKRKKRGFKKKKTWTEKNLCKHGTINRSNSRFRTMHVMTYIFLWYNFHTSYSHQLQFVVFSF